MDPTKDWLLRTIVTLSQGLADMRNKGIRSEIPRPNNDVGDDEVLPEILKEMIGAGKIDEAENQLFRCIENVPLAENYTIGLGFYETLSLLSDEELRRAGWSRREIKEGLLDLHRAVFHETPDFLKED